MSPVLQFIIVGVGTYLIRASAIALAGHFPDPSPQTRATLRLIAPAVLAAFAADQLFVRNGAVAVNWSWWIAALVTGAVAHKWRAAGVTMAIAMVTVWILDAVRSGFG